MTWQRIDENTYIDDTLVTCIEYQLFIDEMREKGKYYQPDHWTSYQFPLGQSREPILGVRHSDAVAFCEWLTNREEGNWNYRLPTIEEIIDRQVRSAYPQIALGYWILDTDLPRFTLIGDIDNSDIRANLAHLLENILTLANASETARIASNDFENDIEIALDLNHTLDIVWNIENDILDLTIPPEISQNVTIPLTLVRALSVSLGTIRHRCLDENYEVNLLLPEIIKIIQAVDNSREYVLNKGSFDLTIEFELILTISLLACVQIFTLAERIAGRSPAFEGIRLVKERIR